MFAAAALEYSVPTSLQDLEPQCRGIWWGSDYAYSVVFSTFTFACLIDGGEVVTACSYAGYKSRNTYHVGKYEHSSRDKQRHMVNHERCQLLHPVR